MRPDEHIRPQLDYGYRLDDKGFVFFGIRPKFREPEVLQEHPIAKARFIKSKEIWKLYWMRASGKWELYEPFPESKHLDEILKTIEEDAWHCFFG